MSKDFDGSGGASHTDILGQPADALRQMPILVESNFFFLPLFTPFIGQEATLFTPYLHMHVYI